MHSTNIITSADHSQQQAALLTQGKLEPDSNNWKTAKPQQQQQHNEGCSEVCVLHYHLSARQNHDRFSNNIALCS